MIDLRRRLHRCGMPGRGADADMQRFIDDTNTGSITHISERALVERIEALTEA